MKKHKKTDWSFIVFNFIFLFTILYFISHTFIGNRGYIRISKLNNEIEKKHIEIINYRKEKEYLENRINLLYDENLDKDLLDELARSYFDLIEEGEICMIMNK